MLLAALVLVAAPVSRAQVSDGEAPKNPPVTQEPKKKFTVDLGGGVTMEFILIRPGSFTMGSNKVTHKVTLTKPFYLGKYEVTQEQWEKVMGNNPSQFKGAKNPVERVSWNDCQSFVAKLQEKVSGQTFRLPTEAEWEYSCRAGATGDYCYGDDRGSLAEYAWYDGNANNTTHPVGEKKPNAWGLYDMHGNVWEWCADWYGEYSATAVDDPQGTSSGAGRACRGGDWFHYAGLCRTTDRYNSDPTSSNNIIGFRVARSSVP
jgi:formylglycine-generating enzyme required for sulfatase activity